jgi:hypothetical protein
MQAQLAEKELKIDDLLPLCECVLSLLIRKICFNLWVCIRKSGNRDRLGNEVVFS